MALTRAQYLAGNTTEGVVLSGQPQGVRQGTGVTIAPSGVISINGSDPSLTSLLRTNNATAYNNYTWPNAIPGTGTTYLSIDASGVISWTQPTGIGVTTITAGEGLTGGGGPGPVTLDVGAGTGIAVDADTVSIADTGVVAGSYTLADITVNSQGQITAATSSNPSSVSVTSVTAGAGLTGGGGPGLITLDVGAGTGITVGADAVSIADTGVVAGTYTGADITVNAQGQITSASSGGGAIPAGSVLAFFQASAPTGFTQITTQDNKSIRIVSGAGGGAGGSIPFTTLFSSSSTYSGSISITSGQVGAHVLSVGQLASHNHYYEQQTLSTAGYVVGGNDSVNNIRNGAGTGSAGSYEAHTHSLVGVGATGNFTSNFEVEYIDMILAAKD